MRYKDITPELFIKNRKKAIEKLKKSSVAIINSNDEMPISSDMTYKFRQNSDLFYLTGIRQEKTILLICPGCKKKQNREILFIIQPNPKLEIWQGHKLTIDEAKQISGINNVKFIDNFDSTFKEIALSVKRIYLNMNESLFKTPVKNRDFRFIEETKKQFPLHKYERLAPILTKLRLQKEPEEIELMQKACDITTSAFYRVLKFIRPGVKEYEIEAEITHEYIRNGADRHAYEPIIASGKDNCVLHYVANDKVCKDGDLVLMDFGAEYAGYAADTTRTIPVNGKFTERQKAVYNAVLRVLKQAIKLINQGTTINEINKKVNSLIELELINLGLAKKIEMNDKKKADIVRMKYFMHGNSHFMGLDVHDVGTKDVKLKEGMVLSCEPGIYIAEEGFGIRLEDDILVTETGQIDLLADEPIEVEDIERLMQAKN